MNERIEFLGVNRMVAKGTWPPIPKKFALYLINRKGVRSADGASAYVVLEGRAELADLKADYINNVVGDTPGGIRLANEWIGKTPDEQICLAFSLSETTAEDVDLSMKGIWLTPEYVECECEKDYLRKVPSDGGADRIACHQCLMPFEDLPDARIEAVQEAGLSYNEKILEFAGY